VEILPGIFSHLHLIIRTEWETMLINKKMSNLYLGNNLSINNIINLKISLFNYHLNHRTNKVYIKKTNKVSVYLDKLIPLSLKNHQMLVQTHTKTNLNMEWKIPDKEVVITKEIRAREVILIYNKMKILQKIVKMQVKILFLRLKLIKILLQWRCNSNNNNSKV